MKRLAAIAAFKLSLYLIKQHDDKGIFARYPRLISPDVTEEELAGLPQTPELLFADQPEMATRCRKLYDLCEGDDIALTAIRLVLLEELDGSLGSLLQEAFGADELTILTAARIAYCKVDVSDHTPAMRRAFDRVAPLLLPENTAAGFLNARLLRDGRIAAWLSGDVRPDPTLPTRCTVFDPPQQQAPAFCRMQTEIERAAALSMRMDGFFLYIIRGEPTSGRRFLAQESARRIDCRLLLVPYDSVSEEGRLLAEPWRRVVRELLLSGCWLCLTGLSARTEKEREVLPAQLRIIENSLAPMGQPAFLTADETVRVVPFIHTFAMQIIIPPCSISEGSDLWRALACDCFGSADGLPVTELAAKMTLTAGQIKHILLQLSGLQPQGPWDIRMVFRLCYQVLDDGRYQNIRFVRTQYQWEDLRLPSAQKQVLEEICSQVEHQGQVLDDWGLRRKFPYGRSVSALFSGAPGTGKTMAAQVLAARLGLELYKIDLSQIVDKYIGETEKRLKQVFDQAEKSNLVLFFDEADALFGKRSEVKEAKDKYANTEVAYLLQRIEEYAGVVLLATNLVQNIDPAFLRRFRYHIVFTLPDESLRAALWHDALPDTVPQQGINFEYLARQFTFSGSQIKNTALNACYKAAADGGVLEMRHLIQAVYQEEQKEGKIMLAGEYGEYGSLLYGSMDAQKG